MDPVRQESPQRGPPRGQTARPAQAPSGTARQEPDKGRPVRAQAAEREWALWESVRQGPQTPISEALRPVVLPVRQEAKRQGQIIDRLHMKARSAFPPTKQGSKERGAACPLRRAKQRPHPSAEKQEENREDRARGPQRPEPGNPPNTARQEPQAAETAWQSRTAAELRLPSSAEQESTGLFRETLLRRARLRGPGVNVLSAQVSRSEQTVRQRPVFSPGQTIP